MSSPDRYELLEELGHGGMATVLRARDRTLGRDVAIKFLRPELLENPRLVARTFREAKTLASLDHPNIVRLYDILDNALVMELLQGRSFERALQDPSWPLRERVLALEQVARAVHFAHERGIVHRDLKPSNIFLEPSGRVVLLDFGLAQLESAETRLTRSGAAVGTPLYMAPEQVRGDSQAIGPHTDVWALGVVLYEIISGTAPFSAPSAARVFESILRLDPPRFTKPVVHDLATIALKALEKDPLRRYASAVDLADDLRRYLNGEAIMARPLSTWRHVARKVQRHPVRLTAAAVALTALLALFAQHLASQHRQALREAALHRLTTAWSTIVERKRELRQDKVPIEQARQDLEQAVRVVDDPISEQPGEPQGYYIRARGRLYLGDLDAAERDASAAVNLAPDFRPGWSLLGMIAMERHQRLWYGGPMANAERYAMLDGLVHRALAYFRKGWTPGREKQESDRWGLPWTREDEVLQNIARAVYLAYAERRHDEGRRHLKEAVERYRAEEYAVWCAVLSDDATEKLAWHERAISWAPGYWVAYHDRAYVRHKMRRDPHGAIEDYTRCLQLEPRIASAFNNRGLARAAVSDLDGAIEDYSCGLRLEPRNASAFNNRGLARTATRDLDGAIEDYSHCLQLEPRNAGAYYNRGLARRAKGDFDGAIKDYTWCIEFDPKMANAFYSRGNARQAKGDLEDAITDYTRSVELAPEAGSAFLNRGTARQAYGDLDGAIDDYSRCIQLDPKAAYPFFSRGSARQLKGDMEGAIQDYTSCIELDPKAADALFNRGVARRATAADAAAADFQQALQVAPPEWPLRSPAEDALRSLRSETTR
ncbi:MAG: tetratricopeptide repeat protein [Planctomycetes bacterium]|nr:tetratricopeptide repeat protein [Planctomycetota bacterium]